MLLLVALLGLQVAASTPVPASKVRWHPDHDRAFVWVYHLPCPKSSNTEIVTCHWSVPVAPSGIGLFISAHRITRYSVALADLNGDDQPEALVYVVPTTNGGEADLCGSGGCELYVLSLAATGYREVGHISISNPPIRILPAITKGWHDLSVRVAGGGTIPGYEARLRFDGAEYPSNPSVLPATRLDSSTGVVAIGFMPPVP